LNGIETLLNLLYLYLAHVVDWPAASLIGFAGATMTLSKTILYWAQEYYCGYCAVGHNSLPDLLLYFALPNGFVIPSRYGSFLSFSKRHRLWIIVPFFIVIRLGKDMVENLNLAAKVSHTRKSD